MTNNRYVKGRAFEYRVRKYYEKHGWYVIRSAGSKGVADLVAISPGGLLIHFIQCKVDGKISKNEVERLMELSKKYSGFPVLARRDGRKLVLIDMRINAPINMMVEIGNNLLDDLKRNVYNENEEKQPVK